MDIGFDEPLRAVVCDKGYDSNTNRAFARERGALPMIHYRSNRKHTPESFVKALCRGRARIAQMMGKLKRFKRVAIRCKKTARNFRSTVALDATFILIKSVNTA